MFTLETEAEPILVPRLSKCPDLQYLSVHVDMVQFITDKDKIEGPGWLNELGRWI